MNLFVAAVVLAAGIALTGCTTSTPVAPAAPAPSVAAPTPPPTSAPELTCEPDADARLVGDVIVNKDCPDLNAAKEKAQQEFAEQQRRTDPAGGSYCEGLTDEDCYGIPTDRPYVTFTWCLDAASKTGGATTPREYDACLAAYKAAAGQ